MIHDPTEFTRERDILIAEVAEVCCPSLRLRPGLNASEARLN